MVIGHLFRTLKHEHQTEMLVCVYPNLFGWKKHTLNGLAECDCIVLQASDIEDGKQ